MGQLYEGYLDRVKQAEAEQANQEQVELLAKYAELAETKLRELNQPYTSDDVLKVASFMIDTDAEFIEQQEKIAEFEEAGRILADAFVTELQKKAAIEER